MDKGVIFICNLLRNLAMMLTFTDHPTRTTVDYLLKQTCCLYSPNLVSTDSSCKQQCFKDNRSQSPSV